MINWLIILIAYLPFQIALNPSAGFDLASIRIFIVLFFVIWLASVLKRRVVKLSNIICFRNLRNIFLLFFLILTAFSLISAENVFWGARKVVFFLSIFPLYFLVVGLIDSSLRVKKVVSVLIGGAGLIGLIGLIQFLSQFIFGLENIYEFWAVNIVSIFSGFNLGALLLTYSSWLVNVSHTTIMRAFSLFSDPHMLSFYLGMILPIAIMRRFIQKQSLLSRWTVPVLFIVLLLTFTRGAYLAIIITFVITAGLLWIYPKRKKAAVFLCLALLIFITPITPIADRFYSSFDLEESSNVGRLEMWQQAGQIGLENLWQGIGLGNYALVVNPELGYRSPITAHNLYLDIFSEMGIIALIVWLVLILGTIWQLFLKLRQSIENKEQQFILIGLIGSLVYFSIHSFFETAVYSPIILSVLMIILGLSTVVIKKQNQL